MDSCLAGVDASDSSTSGNVINFPRTGKVLVSNQVCSDETVFEYHKQSIVNHHAEDEHMNILKEESTLKPSELGTILQQDSSTTRLFHMGREKVHYNPTTGDMVVSRAKREYTC